ncbi:hypothetical protein QUB76_26980, partial [Microcoleus sp. D2B6]|uniref:hypothetical protein n=1 Tax=Microcoleus sp. D2B6 TaxID=3055331 RepID=UPI002FD282CC
TGQLFLILVLLITLAFRSSDYITIFLGSLRNYFLPESLPHFFSPTGRSGVGYQFNNQLLKAVLTRGKLWLLIITFRISVKKITILNLSAPAVLRVQQCA